MFASYQFPDSLSHMPCILYSEINLIFTLKQYYVHSWKYNSYMQISRTHISILALVSIITGIVAPIAQIDGKYLPLPVTNLRIISIFLLLCVMVAFLSAIFQRWKFFRMMSILMTLLILLVWIFIMTGTIWNYRGVGDSVTFSWGWIFFIGWIILFFLQQFFEKDDEAVSYWFLGSVGSLFLLIIISIIVYVSLLNEKQNRNVPILKSFFGTGTRILSWGIALSPPFLAIPSLFYDRINNTLAFQSREIESEKIFIGKGSGISLTLSGINDVIFTNYGGDIYYLISSLYEWMSVYHENTLLLSWPLIVPIWDRSGKMLSWISYIGDGWIWENMSWRTRYVNHMGNDDPHIITNNGEVVTLAFRSGAEWNIDVMGEKMVMPFSAISTIRVWNNLRDSVALIKNGEKYSIVQNNEIFYPVHSSFLPSTFQTNGNDFIFQTQKYNYLQVNWNGETLSWLYEEIGPVLISETASTYAFFGRPIDRSDWCLIVKKKNPVCWFEWFMDPILSADGWTILFAWKKDGTWSIYRNQEVIIKNTNYVPRYQSRDHFSIDPTTPSNYMFSMYDADTDTFTINHSGKNLAQAWRGIGEKVWFTYDNHMITTVQYDTSWHIAEFY